MPHCQPGCACVYDKCGRLAQMCDAHVAAALACAQLAREAERAACAQIADAWRRENNGNGFAAGRCVAEGIAMEIRARR